MNMRDLKNVASCHGSPWCSYTNHQYGCKLKNSLLYSRQALHFDTVTEDIKDNNSFVVLKFTLYHGTLAYFGMYPLGADGVSGIALE